MAEEIIFKTSVDTGTTANDLKEIEKELGLINDSVEQLDKKGGKSLVDLNKKFEDIYGDLQPLTGRLGELEDRMYELALAGKANTDEYKQLQAEVVKYKKTIIDVDSAIDSMSTKGRNMQAALQLGSTITAGYGALTGVQALLGQESENLTKSLVKLQAVQALLASLEEIRGALEKESFLMQKAKTLQTWLLTTATGAYATVVGTSTGAMKLFKIALASTGIGLFIVALGAVVANFDKLKTKAAEVSAKFQDAYKSFANKYPEASKVIKTALEVAFFPITITIKSLQKLYDLFTGTTEASRKASAVQAENHEKHIRQLDEEAKAREENIKGIDRKIALLEAEGKSTIALREEKIKLQKQEAEANLAFAQYMKGRMEGNEIFEQSFQDMVSASEDSLNAIEVAEAKLNQEKKDLAKERNDEAKAEADKQKQLAEEAAKREKDLNDELINSANDFTQKARERREQEQLETTEAYERDRIIRQTVLNDAVLRKQESDAAILKSEQDTNAQILEDHRKLNDAKVQIAQMGAKSLNDLAEGVFAVANRFGAQDEKSKDQRARRQFKVAKALSLATATIDGIQTTIAAFRNGMQNPIPLLGPVTAAVYAGAAAITSAANIAKIASTQYGGGGGGVGSTGGGSVSPPTTAPNIPNPQLADAQTTLTSGIGNEQPKSNAGKVYVVDSEITAKQNQTANTLSIATVG
jgi:hypothetical protein